MIMTLWTLLGLKGGPLGSIGKHCRYVVIMTLWTLLGLKGGPLGSIGKHWRYGVIMTFNISGVEGWTPRSDYDNLDITVVEGWTPEI